MTCAHPMTVVSLFDGIGGFPLAFQSAGAETVATVEIDKAAAGVTADHFPNAKHFADVTEVTPDDLTAAGFCSLCGVVTGGWPCQDLSLAGRRLGLGGARSGLFFEIVRIARGLRPRWLVLENVPGLLSAVCSCPGLGVCGANCTDPHPVRGGACGPSRCMELHGGAMGAVLGALAELGYGFAYRVLDAQHFGVPQRRRRVVIVGCLGDGAAPAQVLLEPEGSGGGLAPSRRTRPDIVRSPAVSSLQGGGRRGHRVDAESAAGGQLLVDVRGEGVYESALTANMAGGGGGADDNTAQGGHLVVATLTRRHGKGPSSDLPDGHVVPVGKVGAVRRLTPVECERLQGYPDGWTATSNGKPQADSARYRQLGNSIAVPVFAWVARRLTAAGSSVHGGLCR